MQRRIRAVRASLWENAGGSKSYARTATRSATLDTRPRPEAYEPLAGLPLPSAPPERLTLLAETLGVLEKELEVRAEQRLVAFHRVG